MSVIQHLLGDERARLGRLIALWSQKLADPKYPAGRLYVKKTKGREYLYHCFYDNGRRVQKFVSPRYDERSLDLQLLFRERAEVEKELQTMRENFAEIEVALNAVNQKRRRNAGAGKTH
jgi:hypothetical protein